jgi:hypothetical protein
MCVCVRVFGRAVLGSLERLWEIVSPHVSTFQIIVFAQSNLAPLVKLLGLEAEVQVRNRWNLVFGASSLRRGNSVFFALVPRRRNYHEGRLHCIVWYFFTLGELCK